MLPSAAGSNVSLVSKMVFISILWPHGLFKQIACTSLPCNSKTSCSEKRLHRWRAKRWQTRPHGHDLSRLHTRCDVLCTPALVPERTSAMLTDGSLNAIGPPYREMAERGSCAGPPATVPLYCVALARPLPPAPCKRCKPEAPTLVST